MTVGLDKAISQLDAAAALAGTELMECVQGGDNVKTTPAAIKTFIGDAAPTGEGQNDGLLTHEDKAKLDGIEAGADVTDAANVAAAGAVMTADVDDTPVDGATTAPISSNWAFDHAADDSAHGNVPAPSLSGPALSVYTNNELKITIVDFDSYATYSVSATNGDATISGDTITYNAPGTTGTDTLTVTVNGHNRELTITVNEGGMIDTPTAAPAIGSALEGGYFTGVIWDKVTTATHAGLNFTSLSVNNEVTLTVASGYLPLYEDQTLRIAPSPTNTEQDFLAATVVSRAGTSLVVKITEITNPGSTNSYTDFVIAARWKIVLAPKSGGENAGLQYKNANSAAPAECFTLTNGPAATAAMIAADTSSVYPLAHWAKAINELNDGEGLSGYTDWYIPARDELELIWRNLKPVTNANYITQDRYNAAAYTKDANLDDVANTHGANRNSDPAGDAYTASVPAQTAAAAFQGGGAEAMNFGSVYYWSSSESSASLAWPQTYDTSKPGYQFGGNKTYSLRARACRRSIL